WLPWRIVRRARVPGATCARAVRNGARNGSPCSRLPGKSRSLEMREDMHKVIVERPRRGGGVQGDGRNWRNSRDRGAHLGMQRGYASRKWLNENLAPLRRWLHKQVHRPWDAVYSELSQGIDRRNPVQAHIYQHIDQFVEREARL